MKSDGIVNSVNYTLVVIGTGMKVLFLFFSFFFSFFFFFFLSSLSDQTGNSDKILFSLVEQYGKNDWNSVSAEMPHPRFSSSVFYSLSEEGLFFKKK